MGNIRKINDEYYIEFEARGLKYQQKAGRDETAARKLLEDVEEKIRRGAEFIVRDADLNIFLEDFCAHIQKRYPPRTVNRFHDAIKHFKSYLTGHEKAVIKLKDLTPRVIDGYKWHLTSCRMASGRQLKPHVVNLTLFLLRDILEYAITCGYIHDNPTLHVRLLPVNTRKMAVVINRENWDAVRNQCSTELKLILDFLRMTGLRFSELKELTWQHIDLQHNRVIIDQYSQQHLPGQNREIPLVVESVDFLKSLRKVTQDSQEESAENVFHLSSLTEKSLNTELAACSAKTGIQPPISLKLIRNTFARDVLAKGVSLIKLMQLTGFSDVARVMCYASYVKVGSYET